MLRDLPEPDRRILQLRLRGYTVPEISAEVDRSEFTVEGVLKRIRKRLKGMLNAEDAGP